jgi:transposase
MTKKSKRKIDAALKAKIALEALREQATVADRALRFTHRESKSAALPLGRQKDEPRANRPSG